LKELIREQTEILRYDIALKPAATIQPPAFSSAARDFTSEKK